MMRYNITMILAVRNEASVIRDNLLFHHAVGVDSFLVVDDNSTDGTAQILADAARDLPLVVCDRDQFHPIVQQHAWYHKTIQEAQRLFAPRWIIVNDADEFWCPVDGALTAHLGTADVQLVQRSNLFASTRDVPNRQDYDPLLHCRYRWLAANEAPGYRQAVADAYRGAEFHHVASSWFDDGHPYPLLARPVQPKVIFNPRTVHSLIWGGHDATTNHTDVRKEQLPGILIHHYPVPPYDKFNDKLDMFDRYVKDFPDFRNNPDMAMHVSYQRLSRATGYGQQEYDGYFIDEVALPRLIETGTIAYTAAMADRIHRLRQEH